MKINIVQKGLKAIDDVPLTWRAAVQILLDADTEAVVEE